MQPFEGESTATLDLIQRELIALPSGGAVIDTPGMRELGVEGVNPSEAFTDIDELALRCRFNDCQHEGEPGCAVREAIAEGLISAERLESYRKLEKEAQYEGLGSRGIEQEKLSKMSSTFGSKKNARDHLESKNRNR